jgi:O-methyltransferase
LKVASSDILPDSDKIISDEDYVRWAYRLLLGREPETEAAVSNSPFLGDPATLVRAFVTSSEFRARHGILLDRYESILPVAPELSGETKKFYDGRGDPVRDWSISLALETIRKEKLEGAMAEVGVYQGMMAKLYHHHIPEKKLHLFDTFEGFPDADLEVESDDRFRDTNLDKVSELVGGNENIIFHKGYFPETAKGLEHERFCFVMLDVDLFAPTKAGMEFFYDRLVPGGYLFAHDYSSSESNWAVSRAIDPFLLDKPEFLIQIPDIWGSVVFRKI